MAKKPFELADACTDLEAQIAKAANKFEKMGKLDHKMMFSVLERATGALKEAVKRLEELEERLDRFQEEYGNHSPQEHH
jgi:Na+/phosphate symporter